MPLFTAVGGLAANVEEILASKTWTPPADGSGTWALIEAIGGGGGGKTGASGGAGGGGGGGYNSKLIRLSELGSSVTVVIGAGGAADSNGGDTSFGSHLVAYGGLAGQSSGWGMGGNFSQSNSSAGMLGHGFSDASGGNGPNFGTGSAGGNSRKGGAGGGGAGNSGGGAGGVSNEGGNGGAGQGVSGNGANGVQPGGGGGGAYNGTGGTGGAGMVRVSIW